jgi:hypothetical protein
MIRSRTGSRRIFVETIASITVLMLTSVGAGAATITSAHYAEPVERYGHFALGRPHEYATLVVNTNTGRTFSLSLPQDEVFEDLQPRLVTLAASQAPLLLTIISSRHQGARLALIELLGERLSISAQSRPIGTPNRWLNPVGVADLDGDGRAEIAAVITPHIGGTLKVYRVNGSQLIEIAALSGFSNHVYRSSDLDLSAPVSVAGQMRLLVPDMTRNNLRIIALQNARLIEIGRCSLSTPITGALTVSASHEISVDVISGREQIVPADC